MKHYKLKISQETRTRPQDDSWGSWERLNKKFSNIEDLRKFLVEMYGKVPFIKGNEVYRDTEGGAEHIGYHYSYWEYSYDRSLPADHKYFATDWITVLEVKEFPAIYLIEKSKKKAS